MAMNTEQTKNSMNKNNGSTDQLVSENADLRTLTDQEIKLTDDDLELTDEKLEEAVGGYFNPPAF
ncbi:hypothetical protein [Moorena sp. SIO3F7]|uniref:Uncharacterized protein n=2 Tax=Coleofasciculaceae TaxID=1892251 RepID=A0A1U7MZ04_9CYAN|nr:hypothetical protein [Moorena sp. SIO3F7]NEO11979.1 hypothetical protein [Moorena sp. SIO3E8]NEQ03525.1 hypothetical protein [Moorena sp. SIO3F7]OLT58948.1 hypothetical protein BJP37_07730 [Moorena bouillonii PNG]